MRHCRTVRFSLCLLGLLALLIPSSLALGTGSEGGFEQESGGYRFKLSFEEHPKTGPNGMSVSITSPDGSPTVGAVVEVSLIQAAGEHPEAELEPHDEAGQPAAEEEHAGLEAEHGESMEGMHAETGEESEAGHGMEGMDIEDHGEAEAEGHPEPEAEEHEETGGHAEEKTVLLKAANEAGLYTGKISFNEAGDWALSVRVVPADGAGAQEVNFPVDVIEAGPPWGVLSGFFGVNLLVIAIAGVLKRKSAAEKYKNVGRA